MNETVYLREDLQGSCGQQDPFQFVRKLDGEVFRDKEGRRTLRFTEQGKSYFLKYHQGIGWAEIFKNLLQGRLPIVSARNEWLAIKALHANGIETMTLAGYGERGANPARCESFVITEDLTNTMSLEFVGEQWQKKAPTVESKRLLITKLAIITRKMHHAGINHRDYYLCHFLLDESFAENNTISTQTKLHLIDLHRAQIRSKVPQRWLIKDLASLQFSAHQVSLTQRDIWRFMMIYSNRSLRDVLTKELPFWQKVGLRSDALLSKWKRKYG